MNLFIKSVIKDFNVPHPKYLWFAQDANGEPKLTLLSTIEKILKIQWTEVILKNRFKYYPLLEFENNELIAISKNEYINHLKDFYENCVIRKLDKIDWVLTLRPEKKLLKGIVCFYTGLLTEKLLQKNASYEQREYFFSLIRDEKKDIGIDAKKLGNASRFFPLLIESEYLTNFNLQEEIQNKIALANLQFKFAIINGTKVPCIFAPEEIQAPADRELLLGVNYSLAYLYKMKEGFNFIDKNTLLPIDHTYYSLKMIRVDLEGLSYSFELPRLRIVMAKQFPDLCHKTLGFDEQRKQYYQIIVSDWDMYQALMQFPNQDNIIVKPNIIPIN